MNLFRKWPAFGGVLIVLGLVEWLYAPIPTLPKSLHKDSPWLLPVVPVAQSETAMKILTKKGLWGALPEVEAEKPLMDPEWRFIGFATNGPQRFVLIKVNGQPEQRLTLNDKLPGGSKILAIENDKICILINGKKRSLGITGISQLAL